MSNLITRRSLLTLSKSSSLARPISTLLNRPNHPTTCTCRTCSAPISSHPGPTRPSSAPFLPTNQIRQLSTIGITRPAVGGCNCRNCLAGLTGAGGKICERPKRPTTGEERSFSTSILRSPTSTSFSLDVLAASGSQMGEMVSSVRGMKVRSAIKKYCNGCNLVKRKGTVFVICSKDKKHKQVRPCSLYHAYCKTCY